MIVISCKQKNRYNNLVKIETSLKLDVITSPMKFKMITFIQLVITLIIPVFGNVNSVPFSWENQPRGQKLKECEQFKDGSGSFVKEVPNLCKKLVQKSKNGRHLSLLNRQQNDCWCDFDSVSNWWSTNNEMNNLNNGCNELYQKYNNITAQDLNCKPSILDVAVGDYVIPLRALSPMKSVEEVCHNFNDFKDSFQLF